MIRSIRSFPPSTISVRALRSLAAAAVLTGAFAWVAAPASAQDQAAIDKLVQLNKKAMDDYDTADFDTAKKALVDAEKSGKRAGLESHPVMARTYIHLGAVYFVGFKDKQKAQHYFGKAIDIQPDIRLDKNLTSSSLQSFFAQVVAQKGGVGGEDADVAPPPKGRKGATPPPDADLPAASDTDYAEAAPRRGRRGGGDEGGGEPDLPANVVALDCPYPDSVPPKKKAILRCAAADNLNVANVNLYYKGFEMTDFESIAMTKSSKGWWQATVPKKAVDGKSLQFYFEGVDSDDKPVVSNGRAESPNVLLVLVPGEKSKGKRKEEDPLALKRLEGADKHFGNRRFWIGVGVGSGFAIAFNGVPESRIAGYDNMVKDVKVTGGGWSRLGQVAPEIGFQINPNWAISIEGRDQWIPQASKVAAYTASGAHSILLKVLHYTLQRQFRFFYGVAGGGGEGIRMSLPDDPQNAQLLDTVRIGTILFGGTAGAIYEVNRHLSWFAEVNALIGMPKSGIGFDLNTGLQFGFGDTSGSAEAAAKKRASSAAGGIDDEEPE